MPKSSAIVTGRASGVRFLLLADISPRAQCFWEAVSLFEAVLSPYKCTRPQVTDANVEIWKVEVCMVCTRNVHGLHSPRNDLALCNK